MNRRILKRLGVAFGLLLLLAGAAAFSGKVRWRVRILAWKFGGSLPYATWPELIAELRPSFLINPPNLPENSVRVKGHGEEPCPVLWDTVLGPFWGRLNDDSSLQGALQLQLLEGIYLRGPVTIRSGDIVIDCGSHLGTFSRFALGRGARLIVAFEPDPTNIACYKRTFQKEIASGGVVLVEAALWDKPGTLKFAETPYSDSGAVRSVLRPGWEPGRVIDVRATTLDDEIRRLNLPQVDFIKWNIEGAERYALRGSRETLARFRPRLVVSTNHLVDDPRVIPPLVLEVVPTYRVLTRGLQEAYFY